jgi:hypothetical protein
MPASATLRLRDLLSRPRLLKKCRLSYRSQTRAFVAPTFWAPGITAIAAIAVHRLAGITSEDDLRIPGIPLLTVRTTIKVRHISPPNSLFFCPATKANVLSINARGDIWSTWAIWF